MTTPAGDDQWTVLAAHEFFADCNERQLRTLAKLSTERTFAAGTELCHQGSLDNEVYVILDGAADVVIDGRRQGSTHPGEIVGELAMLGDGRRAASLVVTSPMRALAFSPDDIDLVLAAVPHAARLLSHHDAAAPPGE
jgi:CRP-like cAMP-binding protein